MHKRRVILEAIQTKLKTVSGFGGVWIQRIPPKRAAWPCLTIYADSETTDTLTIHNQPRPQERTLSVTITAWVRGAADDEKPEKDMDASALLIESGMVGNFGGLDCLLQSTSFNVDEEEPEIHTVELIYQISYDTTESNPI